MPSPSQRRDVSTSPSELLRTQKSFNRRFDFGRMQDETSMPRRSLKSRDAKSFTTFDPFRGARTNLSGYYSAPDHDQHRQRQFRTPEPPVIKDLQDGYTSLQIALYSQVVSELEVAQEELTNEATTQIKANQMALAQLAASQANIVAPVMDAQAKKVMISPNGTEHPEIVEMGITLAQFQRHVDDAQEELTRLWSDWEKADAEILSLGQEMISEPREVDNADNSTTARNLHPEHAAVFAEFNDDIQALHEKGVEEYKIYEKEFLKKIENEAAKAVQIIMRPGFS